MKSESAAITLILRRFHAAISSPRGASFIWDGLEGTLAALSPATRAGGHVCVGEPHWRRWPLPDEVAEEGFVPLAETVERFERRSLPVVTVVAASEDDWDRYVTLSWRAVERWLAEHDDEEIRRQYEDGKRRYLSWQRELLGWAIFVGWNSVSPSRPGSQADLNPSSRAAQGRAISSCAS
jgi:hypothetical protein